MAITILATTDVHGFFPLEKDTSAGVFALKQMKEQMDDPILIDNGDFLIGSPYATFLNQDSLLMPFANELGFDVMVPGNHDFDYGVDFLLEQVQLFNGVYLCANAVTLTDELLFEPYTIIEREGKKVAIIGLITSAMPQISRFETISDVKFLDVIDTLKKWLPIVSEKADLIIVSYHGGIECDMQTNKPTQYDTGEDQAHRILATFPNQIDGLICGHQHRVNEGKAFGADFVQPGYQGQYIGKLTFTFDQKKVKGQSSLLETQPFPKPYSTVFKEADFQNWLTTTIDLNRFKDYLHHFFDEGYYAVSFKGSTIADILETFSPVYSLIQYHLTGQELKDSLKEISQQADLIKQLPEIISSEKDYRVLSNCSQFPAYRIEKQYITNVFDEFMHFLYE
ncbi:MAG TPA: metallophosphoesterase [Candidatus Tetragenococcus pullicola]|nr:metallophosphoesterase [Candidatus Tetragenococcus pullicola]